MIHGVYVKASNGANHYIYGEPGVSADGGLYTVAKDDNTGYYDISHITFCYTITPSTGNILLHVRSRARQ